jgi:hypothetical protein
VKAQYLFNLIDENGEIAGREEILCADDLAALECARTLCVDCSVEIWVGERFVGRIKMGNAPLDASDKRSL